MLASGGWKGWTMSENDDKQIEITLDLGQLLLSAAGLGLALWLVLRYRRKHAP
jgi:hypothetical protein